jgi:hypothetical protein
MKLSELHQIVNLYHRDDHYEDPQVVILIKLPYNTVGSRPMVPVKNITMGFDWESGRFIIMPEEDLTPSDRDFAKKMKEMQDRAGWSDYENRNLKAEIRKLKKQLELKNGQV